MNIDYLILIVLVLIWMQGNRFGLVLSRWFDTRIYWPILRRIRKR